MQAVPPSVYGLIATFTAPYVATLTGTLTANRTYTFPDAAITVAGINLAQTWTATQSFAAVNCTTLTASGNATFSSLVYLKRGANYILTDTADGADIDSITLIAGGGGNYTRGAGFEVYGNEHASQAGNAFFFSGETGAIKFFTGASSTLRLTIDSAGAATFVSSLSCTALTISDVITSTTTGDIFRANAATTASREILIGNTGGSVQFGIESSAAGGVFYGSSAYDGVIYGAGIRLYSFVTKGQHWNRDTGYSFTVSQLGTPQFTIADGGAATFASSVSCTALTASVSVVVDRAASDIALAGPYLQFLNSAGGKGGIWQVGTATLDLWNYNSSWGKILSFAQATGAATFASSVSCTTLTASGVITSARTGAGDLFNGLYSAAIKFQVEVDASGNGAMNLRNAAGSAYFNLSQASLALGNILNVTHATSGDNAGYIRNTHAAGYGPVFRGGGGAGLYLAAFQKYDGTLGLTITESGGITAAGSVSCAALTASGNLVATGGYFSLSGGANPYMVVNDGTNVAYLQMLSGNMDLTNPSGKWFSITGGATPTTPAATGVVIGNGAINAGAGVSGATLTATTGDIVGPKVKLTPEGGIATLVVADEAISVGHVCAIIQGGTANRVKRCPTTGNENDMPVGVAYSAAGAAGDSFWMVVSGRVGVLPDSGVTAAQGYILTTSATTAGLIAQAATAPAAATHFKEIGHFINTGSGAGVITDAIVHFN